MKNEGQLSLWRSWNSSNYWLLVLIMLHQKLCTKKKWLTCVSVSLNGVPNTYYDVQIKFIGMIVLCLLLWNVMKSTCLNPFRKTRKVSLSWSYKTSNWGFSLGLGMDLKNVRRNYFMVLNFANLEFDLLRKQDVYELY